MVFILLAYHLVGTETQVASRSALLCRPKDAHFTVITATQKPHFPPLESRAPSMNSSYNPLRLRPGFYRALKRKTSQKRGDRVSEPRAPLPSAQERNPLILPTSPNHKEEIQSQKQRKTETDTTQTIYHGPTFYFSQAFRYPASPGQAGGTLNGGIQK